MDWLKASYGYCFAVCREKELVRGIEKCLHDDALEVYRLIEKTHQKYGKYPSVKKLEEYFNLKQKMYCPDYNLQELADAVKSTYSKDRVTDAVRSLQKILVQKNDVKATKILERINQLQDELQPTASSEGHRLSEIREVIKRHYHNDSALVCDFGFKRLDEYTGGIRENQYIIIYANTSEGKSTIARAIAANIAMQGKTALYITLEEGSEASIIKAHSTISHFSPNRVREKNLKVEEQRRIKKVCKQMKGDVIFYDSLDSYTTSELVRLCNQWNPDVLFVDQISHFSETGDPDWQQVTKTSKLLQKFAQRHIPTIALAQATRKTKKGKPTLEESIGLAYSIVQDAHIAIFLHPTDYDGDAEIKRCTILKDRDNMRNQSFELIWKPGKGVIRDTGCNLERLQVAQRNMDHYEDFTE